MTNPIRDGIFFTLPPALPRGRHKLPREQVTAAQRERLLAAMTELLAARGYLGFGPADIAGRAGVSLGTFYGCFRQQGRLRVRRLRPLHRGAARSG